MPPLVSILIPAYNAAELVGSTIESAIAQTWPRKEIIVVDDGSTDDTLAVARRFESRGVKVIGQNNQGAAATRNRAYASSQGDYIQWLDADDLLTPDKIARQMEAASRSGAKRILFSAGWGYFIYRPRKARFVPTPLWENLSPLEWMTRKMEGNFHMQTATWLVSRELTEAAGPWDPRLVTDDDGEYFGRVLLASEAVQFVPEGKVLYRISGPGSVSYIGASNRKLEAQFLSMELHLQYIRSLADTPRVRAACLTYLQEWQNYFHPERPDLVQRCEQLAASVGGHLTLPVLSWKYAWIEKLFGASHAKRAQLRYNRLKSRAVRGWDKALFRLEQRTRRWTPESHFTGPSTSSM